MGHPRKKTPQTNLEKLQEENARLKAEVAHPEFRESECQHNPIVFLNLIANRKLSTVNTGIRH